jgi:HPt (histidine-containing phosphotransfer) domain-containing protein
MSPENEPSVDVEKAMHLFDGDMEFFKKMCGKFLEYIPGQIDRLSGVATAGNPEMVEFYAHGIKGAAANLCAVKTCSIASRIEDSGHAGNISDVPLLIDDLRSEILRLEDFVRTLK